MLKCWRNTPLTRVQYSVLIVYKHNRAQKKEIVYEQSNNNLSAQAPFSESQESRAKGDRYIDASHALDSNLTE